MPGTLTIGVFVLGAVMLLLALVSGGFKIFGSEMPGLSSRPARIIAFVIGVLLVGFSLYHFQDGLSAKPTPDAKPPVPAPVVPEGGGPKSETAPHHPVEILTDATAVRMFGREGADFGVPPRNSIEDNVGTYTPLTIPGARTITTGELAAAIRGNRQFLLIDVLDTPHPGLPGARRYPGVGMPNPSTDPLQLLEKDTRGDLAYPVVFYCQGPQCWESYNAALRARDGGYTNVYWYRGGIEAWMTAGFPAA